MSKIVQNCPQSAA